MFPNTRAIHRRVKNSLSVSDFLGFCHTLSLFLSVCLSVFPMREFKNVSNRVGKEELMLTQSSAAVILVRHNVVYWGGSRRIIHKKEKENTRFNFQNISTSSKMSNLLLTLTWTNLWALASRIFTLAQLLCNLEPFIIYLFSFYYAVDKVSLHEHVKILAALAFSFFKSVYCVKMTCWGIFGNNSLMILRPRRNFKTRNIMDPKNLSNNFL